MKLSCVVACETVTLYPDLGASDSLRGSVPSFRSPKAQIPRHLPTQFFQVLYSTYIIVVEYCESTHRNINKDCRCCSDARAKTDSCNVTSNIELLEIVWHFRHEDTKNTNIDIYWKLLCHSASLFGIPRSLKTQMTTLDPRNYLFNRFLEPF
jgi:hypothetical protein